jgi:hypothetical protein
MVFSMMHCVDVSLPVFTPRSSSYAWKRTVPHQSSSPSSVRWPTSSNRAGYMCLFSAAYSTCILSMMLSMRVVMSFHLDLFGSAMFLVPTILSFSHLVGLFSSSSTPSVYNDSATPATLPWDAYNYCNSPHVNPEHYSVPANIPGCQLVYLNVLIRHHKVYSGSPTGQKISTEHVAHSGQPVPFREHARS